MNLYFVPVPNCYTSLHHDKEEDNGGEIAKDETFVN